ncbi:MAG TPA: DNA polymerase ligase N-terminal domain-containing protein [Planctomycetaceae bacterium]|nr:DNA polymerase ligase N-terminal domain-containing protein [Planctomycetaceae bacterium]
MPRFAVLTHDHPTLHWDFLLEQGEKLRTWRLAQPPDAAGPIDAEALADHRLAYLDYEGPVSGGRGEVRRWDRGEYEVVESTSERLVVRLAGERLRGEASLERPAETAKWTFRLNSPSI